jgi:hypothetical protein
VRYWTGDIGNREGAGGKEEYDRPLDDSHTLGQMWGFRFYEALHRIEKARHARGVHARTLKGKEYKTTK